MKKKHELLFVTLLCLFSSLLIERVISINEYSIEDLPLKIKSLKNESKDMEIMGASEFLESSNTLFGNQINLHMWHGNQHIEFPLQQQLRKENNFSFSYRLKAESILDLTLKNKETNSFDVIRLEAKKKIKIIKASNIGEFTKKVYMTSIAAMTGTINIKNQDVYINGHKVLALSYKPIVGVRGNYITPISIFNININSRDISLRPPISVKIIFLLFAMLGILLLPFHNMQKSLIAIVLTFLCLVLYGSYILYFQKIYPASSNKTIAGQNELIKNEKKRINNLGKNAMGAILFIGSSQTFGEGASQTTKRWTDLYCKRMNESLCLNLGIRSAVSATFVDISSQILKLRPRQIFFILSSNDQDIVKHKNNVKLLFTKWKKNKIDVIVIPEPDFGSLTERSPLQYNVANLAIHNGFKLIEIIEEFRKKNDSGWLWWDKNHLTDYGHQVFSNYLIKKLLNKKDKKLKIN